MMIYVFLCHSKTCSGASDLKKVIESKETIIQLVGKCCIAILLLIP